MKSPITDASRMTAIGQLSPFFDRLPGWKSKLSIRMVAGFAEKKEFGLQRLNLNRRAPVPAHFVQMLRSPGELHIAIKISNG
jgi:hypothetical protein